MNAFQMKHRRRVFVLASVLLVAASSVALAEQEATPAQQRSWFWSWFSPSPAPAAKPKPAPARVAGQTEPGKPGNNCSFFNCITLVGIGF